MHDWFFRHGGGRKRLIDWLGIDAWIDSSLAETWQSLQDRWNAVTSFFARFRLSGWKRLLNEAIAEGLTLGVDAHLPAAHARLRPPALQFLQHFLHVSRPVYAALRHSA